MNYRETGGGTEARSGGVRAWLAERPQMPYILPFFGYVALMAPATFGHIGGVDWETLWKTWHPLIYFLENATAAVLLWYLWDYYRDIRWTKLGLGAVVGIVGTLVWVGIEYGCQRLGISKVPDPAKFYNPDLMLSGQWARWGYFCVRLVGPTLVVPLMEELFFRDFLMRALVRGGRFEDVPLGTFTWFSFLGMSVLFGVNHAAEWPEGIAYGLMMGVLLIRTRSLGSCIVAHGVTNLTLYLYVIYMGDWQFM
jgi:CAAX prenyl protease-like protein